MENINNSYFKILICGLVSFFCFVGCQSDFLDKKPQGQLTSGNFFEVEDHAVWATNAVYDQLRSWDVHVFSYIGLTDIISDDADKGSTPSDGNFLIEVDNFTFDAGNLAMNAVWSGYYHGIYRANIALENIPNIEMDEALKERLMAECKFLRAYYYFKLVRWFGDLPLIIKTLESDEFSQPRTAKAEVYAQIISDLEDAIEVLPTKHSSADVGRATSGAAKGLLAKVMLTTQDYQRCSQLTKEIIESGTYGLMSNYREIFTEVGENSTESLFEVQTAAFETGGGGSQYNEVQGVRGVPNLGWGFNRPSDDLVGEFEPGDPRREATILYVGEVLPDGSGIIEDNPNIVNERYNQKAWVPTHAGGNGNGPGNIRILRYSDVLLMAAEAMNELGVTDDALTYLNMVRARARGQSNFILKDITITDKDALRESIWHERRVELAMEQNRWFDIVRQGRAAQVMISLGKSFEEGVHELLPLPQSEIDLSGGELIQNNGY